MGHSFDAGSDLAHRKTPWLGNLPGWSELGRKRVALPSPSLSLSSLQSFNTYFSNEHSRLLLLWKQVVGVRRLVSEVKLSTER